MCEWCSAAAGGQLPFFSAPRSFAFPVQLPPSSSMSARSSWSALGWPQGLSFTYLSVSSYILMPMIGILASVCPCALVVTARLSDCVVLCVCVHGCVCVCMCVCVCCGGRHVGEGGGEKRMAEEASRGVNCPVSFTSCGLASGDSSALPKLTWT